MHYNGSNLVRFANSDSDSDFLKLNADVIIVLLAI